MITNEDYWNEFCKSEGLDVETPYSSWCFGNSKEMAEDLANLVIKGDKRATTSLKAAYDWDEDDDYPTVGEYSIITDFYDKPKCIIRTSSVEVRRFCDVDEEFAFTEGEGDKSLSYWQEAHIEFFSNECKENATVFSEEMEVVLEIFEVVYI